MKSLLQEISLASVTPYATQFVWRQPHPEDDIWECDIEFEDEYLDYQKIKMVMHRWKTPVPAYEYEYQFAFFSRSAPTQPTGWSTSATNSAAAGNINVLALLKTVGLAIRDFADQRPDCDVIDITGADSAAQKGEQKTRIYQQLFADNGMNTGFVMKSWGGKLYLIRTGIRGRTADATGVRDM